jgi:hypothetical protein
MKSDQGQSPREEECLHSSSTLAEHSLHLECAKTIGVWMPSLNSGWMSRHWEKEKGRVYALKELTFWSRVEKYT